MQNDSPRLLGLLLSVSRPDSPGKILYEAISLRLSFSRLPPQLSVVSPASLQYLLLTFLCLLRSLAISVVVALKRP